MTRPRVPASLVRLLASVVALGVAACTASPETTPQRRPPNIVLVITDDQGWAQLGLRGDPDLETPHLDRLAAQSADFTRFYASPVCAPTRASLITGRHAYRTGVTDTWLGRALMAPDETTVAEALRAAGYRTGIFGKWHLGDSHPMRPQDQGFDEVLVHRGGGIGQPSDPPGGSDYADPLLFHNGEARRFTGYVTDVLFDEAMRFMDAAGEQPFFAYLATNAPHAPYLVPDAYRSRYAARGLDDRDARIYGMIANIDDNIGRLLAWFDARDLTDDTLLIFMSDNGPTTERYTAGLRARKSSTYEGGIRVPFFLRWPARVAPAVVETAAAHIDVMPTLLAAAGVPPPEGVHLDGRNLLPLVEHGTAAASDTAWAERTIHIQAHRGRTPQPFRNFAAIGPRYKLVQGTGFAVAAEADAAPELYDLVADPGERQDLAAALPDVVRRLSSAHAAWFGEVSATRGFDPLPITLGSPHEPHVTLTRQDWHPLGPDGWGAGALGVWEVDVPAAATFDVHVELPPEGAFAYPFAATGGRIVLEVGGVRREIHVTPGEARRAASAPAAEAVVFAAVDLPAGRTRVDVRAISPDGREDGVWFVHVSAR